MPALLSLLDRKEWELAIFWWGSQADPGKRPKTRLIDPEPSFKRLCASHFAEAASDSLVDLVFAPIVSLRC